MPHSVENPHINQVMKSRLARGVIEEAVGNWTQDRKVMDPTVSHALNDFSIAVAKKILDAEPSYPEFGPVNWKGLVSNKVYDILKYDIFKMEQIPIIVEALREKYGDTRHEFDGLWGYSLAKIANTVGCVAYMVVNGLDPELLTLTQEEAQKSLAEFAERLRETMPEQVLEFDPHVDTLQDLIDEIRVRTDPPDISYLFEKKE